MKVLIIPEDPTRDQFILKPIVERIFKDIGRSARIEVLQDPHLRSVNQALNKDLLRGIVEDNPMVDLFLLMLDNDCNAYNADAKARDRCQELARLTYCLAIEEVEVWMLALHSEFRSAWRQVRLDCHPKESYCQPFLARQGWNLDVGGGYKRAMRDLGKNWASLLQLCPEVRELLDHLRTRLG